MSMTDKIKMIRDYLIENGIEFDYASPNMVADIAYNLGLELSSSEIVIISDSI